MHCPSKFVLDILWEKQLLIPYLPNNGTCLAVLGRILWNVDLPVKRVLAIWDSLPHATARIGFTSCSNRLDMNIKCPDYLHLNEECFKFNIAYSNCMETNTFIWIERAGCLNLNSRFWNVSLGSEYLSSLKFHQSHESKNRIAAVYCLQIGLVSRLGGR